MGTCDKIISQVAARQNDAGAENGRSPSPPPHFEMIHFCSTVAIAMADCCFTNNCKF